MVAHTSPTYELGQSTRYIASLISGRLLLTNYLVVNLTDPVVGSCGSDDFLGYVVYCDVGSPDYRQCTRKASRLARI